MKLLDKIKTALFEDDEEQEQSSPVIEKKVEVPIAKKIDIEKTEKEFKKEEELREFKKEEKIKGPIIFDDEDFLMEVPKKVAPAKVEPKKEEKILYGGYDNKDYGKNKEKFKPSPVLSPVYGVIDGNLSVSSDNGLSSNSKKSLDYLLGEEKKNSVDLDSIRQKAYGDILKEKEKTLEDKSDLLYDMRLEEKVAVDKITLGDAEEYFNDLGLEYNVDYKDKEKEKMTRSTKNKQLVEIVEEEIKEEEKIKEELKQKEEQDVEEKNLYDLIDMMYDSKE